MTRRWTIIAAVALLVAVVAGALTQIRSGGAPRLLLPVVAGSTHAPVWFSGLQNPRGMLFTAEGELIVAEGGRGGRAFTGDRCKQVPAPTGPYRGGLTARISAIGPDRKRRTLVDRLPSTELSPISGSIVSGVADLATIGDRTYALITGGGCSHGVPSFPNSVIELRAGGRWRMVADLSLYLETHPTAKPDLDDFEPDGNWYSMLAHDGRLVLVESNGGQIVEVDPSGGVRRLTDVSAARGQVVPTALAVHAGSLYVAEFGTFPVQPRTQTIDRVLPDGRIAVAWRGFTAVVDILFRGGRLYVLETTTEPPDPPIPKAGDIVELDLDSGERRVLLTGLTAPTAMVFGPDGALYVTNFGFLPERHRGEILRVDEAVFDTT